MVHHCYINPLYNALFGLGGAMKLYITTSNKLHSSVTLSCNIPSCQGTVYHNIIGVRKFAVGIENDHAFI